MTCFCKGLQKKKNSDALKIKLLIFSSLSAPDFILFECLGILSKSIVFC